MNTTGFCDLNISIPFQDFQTTSAKELVSLGYRTIALNTTVEEESNEVSKKKKNQNKEFVPAPKSIGPKISQELNGKLQILQRLTVYISDANQLQKLCKSENAKKYDIISVIPTSTTAFQLACNCKDVDMISFDACARMLRLNRRLYNLGLANGNFFEIPYGPAIADAGKRRNTIQIAHGYHYYGKSKNIIITSGATDILRVRGPYDVTNLGILFGLSEEQAKHSMLRNARALILRAEGRRFGRTAMTMMITDLDLESEEESDDEPVAKRSKTTACTDMEMSVC